MKAVLISIQPKWCELIASGRKTVEVRKTKPKIEIPFKCYIYCTQGKGITDNFRLENNDLGNSKVIGEFVCDKFYDIIQYGFGAKVFTDNLETEVEPSEFIKMSCLSEEQIFDYIGNKDGYGWHISDLVIYDKPKELSEFYLACNKPSGTDCSVCIDHRENRCKSITRPPQSWCYVEELR